MRLRDLVTQQQLRWSDVNWGKLDGDWPAISFSQGTSAWSQLRKIDVDAGEAVISVCAGRHASPETKRRITGFSLPDRFTAPTQDLVEPELFTRSVHLYGGDRWPNSIGVRKAYRFVEPPSIDGLVEEPRLLTGTRGRYLADLHQVAPNVYAKLANLEVEEVDLYRSPAYLQKSSQPVKGKHRQSGWTPDLPTDIQSVLLQKVQSIYNAERQSGGLRLCKIGERYVVIGPSEFEKLVFELWEEQRGRCGYCRVPMESDGLAQVSIDRIDNKIREYGRHNVHLTCWFCNRGKNNASHDDVVELMEKRRRALEADLHSVLVNVGNAAVVFTELDGGSTANSEVGVHTTGDSKQSRS
ncbi:hypothetical protein [Azospirillum argentinense]